MTTAQEYIADTPQSCKNVANRLDGCRDLVVREEEEGFRNMVACPSSGHDIVVHHTQCNSPNARRQQVSRVGVILSMATITLSIFWVKLVVPSHS